jgi:hypothetical protein
LNSETSDSPLTAPGTRLTRGGSEAVIHGTASLESSR